jgi:hypothetical protein
MSTDNDLLDSGVRNVENSMETFSFPLDFEFKIASLVNDFVAKDAHGKTVGYVRQKLFKFKEAISVYSDESMKHVHYTIDADRVIDFNSNYAFTDAGGKNLGRIGRRGAKSLLKASYQIFDSEGEIEFTIQEENPWAKFFDFVLGEVPLLGMFTGYLFNPRYIVKRVDGTLVARLSKEASFFGRRFKLTQLSSIEKGEDERLLLGLMMMSLLERRRG